MLLNNPLWLSWLGATVAAGLLFGLATWLPFTGVRFLPSRLLLAVAALLPIAAVTFALAAYGVGRVVVEAITKLLENASS